MVDKIIEKGIEKIIYIFGEERVSDLLNTIEMVNELLYGEVGLNVYLPYETDTEIVDAEKRLTGYLKTKLNFQEDYEEEDFLDICRRLQKTYEGNELKELKLFLKLVSGISGMNVENYFLL